MALSKSPDLSRHSGKNTFITKSKCDMAMAFTPPRLTQITPDQFIERIRVNSDSANIRYVSPGGKDANDGFSWATAKETVLAAYDSIKETPGSIESKQYGIIYIAHRSKIDQDERQGIWIMGREDPYWWTGAHTYDNDNDHPPAGWRKAKHVLFKGVGGEILPYGRPVAAQLGQLDVHHAPHVYYVCDERSPAIWISGASEIAFEDLLIRNRRIGIYLGKAREGFNHRNNDDASYCYFRNVCIDVIGASVSYLNPRDRQEIIQEMVRARPELRPFVNDPARINPEIEQYVHERVGPCVYSEKGLKVAFENCVFSTTHLEQRKESDPELEGKYRGYSDNRACIVARTPSVIQISNCVFKGGNFKYYAGTHPFAFDIRDCFFEGSFIVTGAGGVTPMGPLVHLIAAHQGSAFIENVGAGDLNVRTPGGVKVEGSEQVAGDVMCINVATVIGPATILNIPLTQRWQNITSTLARQRQVGFWQGRVSAQHDSARRTFSPVAARFRNLVNQDPFTWRSGSPHGGPSIQTGVIAPDGTSAAVRLSPILPDGNIGELIPEQVTALLYYVNDTQSANTPKIIINKGDVIAAGVWVRAVNQKLGLAPWDVHLLRAELHPAHGYKFDNDSYVMSADSPLKGDGEWEWISVIGRVEKVMAVPTTLWMILSCARQRYQDESIDYVHDFYAPILLHVPSSDLSNNEIYELRQHMSTWPDNVEPGTVSVQRGQDFALQSHIISRGSKPEVLIGKERVEVDGNDVSGRILVRQGSIIPYEGIIASFRFSKPFRSKPRILLTAANHYAGTIPIFVSITSESEFSIRTTTMTSGQLGEDSEWNYFVIE